jgi:hypothetical protein
VSLAKDKIKIRVLKSNTESAQYTWVNYLTTGLMLKVHDYIDELRQQALWNAEKCQRES